MPGSDDTHSTLAELFAGRYTVHERLPWNGLAIVYRARALAGDLALAVLPLDCDGDSHNGPAFHKAVAIVREIAHPAFVPIQDAGVQLGVPFIAYEWRAAEPLAVLLEREGSLQPRRALRVGQKLLEALAALHARGMHHGDLTPSNVLIDEATESVFILGAGIAPLLRRIQPDATGPTGRGSGKGAVRYLPPEVIGGARVGPAADQFSVAQLVHRMITGDPPGMGDRMYPHVPGLREVIERATRRQPGDRYEDVDALRRELALEVVNTRSEAPTSAPPPPLWESTTKAPEVTRPERAVWPWFVGATIIIASLGVAFWITRPETPDEPALVLGDVPDQPVIVPPVPDPAQDPEVEPDLPVEPETHPTDPDESGTDGDPIDPDVEPVDPDAVDLADPDEVDPDESDLEGGDLLQGELPELLAETMQQISEGYQFEQSDFRRIFGWIRNNRDDVRGPLVLGRAYMSRGWYTAAFERYEPALRRFPEAKNEQTLRDLIEIVERGDGMVFAVWPNIRRYWGRSALPAVDRALAVAESRVGRRELERLKARVRTLPE